MRLASRGVMCGTVSSPVRRWISAASDSESMRRRARGLELMSTASTSGVAGKLVGRVQHGIGIGALGRIELHDPDELPALELGREGRFRAPPNGRGLIGFEDADRGGDPTFGLEPPDRLGHGSDVLGPGPAAPAHDRHPEFGREPGEPRQVGRRGWRHVDPAVAAGQHPGVGEGGHGQPGLAGVAENLQGAHGAGRAVDADGEQIEIGEIVDHPRLLLVRVGRPFGGEGEQTDQRKVADLTNRLDRQRELVKAKKGLEKEQIGAAPGEHLRLFRVAGGDDPGPVRLVEIDDPGERPDGAGDEAVDPRDLARLASELDRGGVGRFDEVGGALTRQPRARGAEGRRFDELGARLEIGEVDIENHIRVGQGGGLEARPDGQPTHELRSHGTVTDDHTIHKPTADRVTHGGGSTSLDVGITGAPRSASWRSGKPPARTRVTVGPT